ncbi:MAG: CCA tRNA nucleotidyltransferase [Streptococcaceae bacterium]|nr:CCA tRNA nucleotidyltransferase [Streptococcaceae bacterium]
MKINNLPCEFKKAMPIVKRFKQASFVAYFVGGSVRNFLLGKEICDIDIATSAYPAEIKKIFSKTVDIGIEHGTVIILYKGRSYEVTTFRTESAYQDYRKPDKVNFVRTLADDLKRRDFTINALAMDSNGEIIDLFAGKADLKAKIIRAVGDAHKRFHEDALRMMRAFRFASQLGFIIESTTYQAIEKNIFLLEKISVERIQIEFIKLMLGEFRNKGLQFFIKSKAFLYLPFFKQKNSEFLKELLLLPNDKLRTSSQVWALLGYFLNLSKNEFHKFLHAWKEAKNVFREAYLMLKLFKKREHSEWTNELLFQAGIDVALLTEELVQLLFRCGNSKKVKEKFAKLPITSRNEIVIDGNDLKNKLNRPPGEWLGCMITDIERLILEGKLKNEYQAIMKFVKNEGKNDKSR